MKVRYQWSEDGEVELCERETITNRETVPCYHCDCPIKAKEEAVKLTSADGSVYVLHPVCADRGCSS